MDELTDADRGQVLELFAGLCEYNLSILTVIEGRSPGRVWVDDPRTPRIGLVATPEGQCLAGDCRAATADASLKALIPFGAYLTVAPRGWVIAREHARFHWHSADDFLSNGFGFCIVRGGAVAAWCLTDCVSGDRCEIGIDTDTRFRRQGLASLAVAATVSHSLDRGLTPEDAAAGRKHAGFRYAEAECRALAGSEEDALATLQQMRDDDLEIPIDWLGGHWAFASLRKTDSWQRLLRRGARA